MVKQAGCQGKKICVSNVGVWLLIKTNEEMVDPQLNTNMQQMDSLQNSEYFSCALLYQNTELHVQRM